MNIRSPVNVSELRQDRCAGHLDHLKAAVDGYRVENETRDWTAWVHGLYLDGDHSFLQLCDTARPGVDLLVRISPSATVPHILAALKRWTPPSELSMSVLTV